jgi:hypothetical protein
MNEASKNQTEKLTRAANVALYEGRRFRRRLRSTKSRTSWTGRRRLLNMLGVSP